MINRLDGHEDQAGAWDVLRGSDGLLAFDVGCNVGQSTRVLARNFARVVALEACQESYDILAAEMPSNVTALCLAAAAWPGEVTLEEASRSISTGQLVTGPGLPMWGPRVGTRTVPATTLDLLTDRYGPPDFVKIDVEGAEVLVLEGARYLLAEHHPRVIVEVHQAANGPLVRDLLAGYQLTELRHGDYVKPDGEIYRNHFWLHGHWGNR
jgi:FkbM family methyltransferase